MNNTENANAGCLQRLVRPLAWRVEVYIGSTDSGFYEHETEEQAEADAAQRTKDFGVLGFRYLVRPNITEGQTATLSENDCFGSTSSVVVLKIHKGGNVLVQDGQTKREVSARNLRPNDKLSHGAGNQP